MKQSITAVCSKWPLWHNGSPGLRQQTSDNFFLGCECVCVWSYIALHTLPLMSDVLRFSLGKV